MNTCPHCNARQVHGLPLDDYRVEGINEWWYACGTGAWSSEHSIRSTICAVRGDLQWLRETLVRLVRAITSKREPVQEFVTNPLVVKLSLNAVAVVVLAVILAAAFCGARG